MALSLASISAKSQVRAPRMLLVGTEKIGKTCFACGCDHDEDGNLTNQGLNSPVVLPVKGEEGVDDLDVPSFPTLRTYEELIEALGVLCTEDHEYGTVVIDSASALEPLVWDYVSRVHNVASIEKVDGGFGKGYVEAVNAFREILDGLDHLRSAKNMASVLIGHVKVKRFDAPDGDSYDTYKFDVNDKADHLIRRWADVILFANSKVSVHKEDQGFGKERARGLDLTGGQRFLFTQKRPYHPGGGRGIYGRLPYELPLNWSAFMDAVNNAQQAKEGTA